VKRAVDKNPSSAIAAANILRADALLAEARAGTRLQINGNLTTTTLNRGVEFQDTTVVPRNSVTANLDLRMPLVAPVRWARRAQEALGVLLVADGPVDAIDEPTFDTLPDVGSGFSRTVADDTLLQFRPDLKLFSAQQQAADRVLRDSSKDYWPYLEAVFQPQSTYPAQFFTPPNSWRFLLQLSVPLFDSGLRKGQKLERQAAFDITKATFTGALTEARSEVRTARAAVASAERSLTSARAAADQAQQVVNITNISFRAGAATNIEVIDAERRARDAD